MRYTVHHGLVCLLMGLTPLMTEAENVIVPDYDEHLGVDILAPGGPGMQADAPVVWNGPRATVTYMGSVSKVTGHSGDDSRGDGYGTMMVRLRVHLAEPTTFRNEVDVAAVTRLLLRERWNAAEFTEDTLPELIALQRSDAMRLRLKDLRAQHTKHGRLDRRAFTAAIVEFLDLETTMTTDTVEVIVGHIRPSRAFVRSDDPQERFTIGLRQGDIRYRIGSIIEPGTLLGYMERDRYEGSSTHPHVHFGAFDPKRITDDRWRFRGRAPYTSRIRTAFIEAESALRVLASQR